MPLEHNTFITAVLHAAHISVHCQLGTHGNCYAMQGLAVGFVLLRVEALTEEGKL